MALSAAHEAIRFNLIDCGHAAYLNKVKGASFCHVVSSKAVSQEREVITEGYQK
jgi:hypothetical protein